MAQSEIEVLYFGDPMCSWCYGFSPEFSKLYNSHQDEFKFSFYMGGLRPHNKQSMFELAEFLKGHWSEVHKRSGQPFSYDILESTEINYDTEPACRAVVTAKTLVPEHAFNIFKDIQKAFYAENKNPINTQTYTEIFLKYGIEKTQFTELFLSQKMRDETQSEFDYASSLGVRGFPSVVIKQGEKMTLIASGYLTYEELIKRIGKLTE